MASLVKGNIGTILVVVVLAIVLLAGTALFGYFGLRLLSPGSPPPDQLGMATPGDASGRATTAAKSGTRASGSSSPSRTPIVIIAKTAAPFTPDAASTSTPGSAGGEGATEASQPAADTPTPPRLAPTSDRNASGSGGTSHARGLPQTGVGLGMPIFGFLLAGLATALHWWRRRR